MLLESYIFVNLVTSNSKMTNGTENVQLWMMSSAVCFSAHCINCLSSVNAMSHLSM